MIFTTGHVLACIGLGLTFILGAIGSSVAVGRTGVTASALLSKDPSNFTSFLILSVLPSTQSIYCFIVAFLGLNNMGIMSGDLVAEFSTKQGLGVLFVGIPTGIIGLVSALYQGRVAMSGMELCTKQEKQMGKAIVMTALVEFFAILAFVLSLLFVMGITG